jgi:hypothetical protein
MYSAAGGAPAGSRLFWREGAEGGPLFDSRTSRFGAARRCALRVLAGVADESSARAWLDLIPRALAQPLDRSGTRSPPAELLRCGSKGVGYGRLARRGDGTWDVSGVEGIPASSLVTAGAAGPPSLIIRPFHQSGTVISIRQFTEPSTLGPLRRGALVERARRVGELRASARRRRDATWPSPPLRSRAAPNSSDPRALGRRRGRAHRHAAAPRAFTARAQQKMRAVARIRRQGI